MIYPSTGIYGIHIHVYDGDRELDPTEINTSALAQQLRDFADIIQEGGE